MVLTYNEAPNLARTLSKLDWANEVLIVDSFSDDETPALARSRPKTRMLQRRFDTFANQCNYGLEHIATEWVLSLDADYVLSDELVNEIAALNPPNQIAGYRANFQYCIYNQPLRASLYPPRVILYRKSKAKYRDEGHGHRVEIDGLVKPLAGVVRHDDRKPLERWFAEQMRYAEREAEYLSNTPREQLNRADRIRQWIVPAPFAVLVYTLLFRGLIMDGRPGWFYAFQRALAELVLSLKLLEKKWR